MLKIRRPLGRLIFNMGIVIPGKTVFLIQTPPLAFCVAIHLVIPGNGPIEWTMLWRPKVHELKADFQKPLESKDRYIAYRKLRLIYPLGFIIDGLRQISSYGPFYNDIPEEHFRHGHVYFNFKIRLEVIILYWWLFTELQCRGLLTGTLTGAHMKLSKVSVCQCSVSLQIWENSRSILKCDVTILSMSIAKLQFVQPFDNSVQRTADVFQCTVHHFKTIRHLKSMP